MFYTVYLQHNVWPILKKQTKKTTKKSPVSKKVSTKKVDVTKAEAKKADKIVAKKKGDVAYGMHKSSSSSKKGSTKAVKSTKKATSKKPVAKKADSKPVAAEKTKKTVSKKTAPKVSKASTDTVVTASRSKSKKSIDSASKPQSKMMEEKKTTEKVFSKPFIVTLIGLILLGLIFGFIVGLAKNNHDNEKRMSDLVNRLEKIEFQEKNAKEVEFIVVQAPVQPNENDVVFSSNIEAGLPGDIQNTPVR